MLTVLRWGNIIADRAAPELTAKLCGSFQEVRRYLGKRAVVFYELYAVSPQVLFVYIATPSEKKPALIPFDNISPLNNHSIK